MEDWRGEKILHEATAALSLSRLSQTKEVSLSLSMFVGFALNFSALRIEFCSDAANDVLRDARLAVSFLFRSQSCIEWTSSQSSLKPRFSC